MCILRSLWYWAVPSRVLVVSVLALLLKEYEIEGDNFFRLEKIKIKHTEVGVGSYIKKKDWIIFGTNVDNLLKAAKNICWLSGLKQSTRNRVEPWSSGYGRRLMFERLWVWIPALYTWWTFFHIYLLKKLYCLFEKTKNKQKRGWVGPFSKNSTRNNCT